MSGVVMQRANAGVKSDVRYKIWISIRNRCNNQRCSDFVNYGGRGIKCLYSSFDEFCADVGMRPDGFQIDRIDNNLGYQIGNCRWVTRAENNCNRRDSKWWKVNGVIYESSTHAAAALGVHVQTVWQKCHGRTHRGKWCPPIDGWSCWPKYAA